MIYEDDYAEESVENGDFDIAIPFRLTLREGGEPEITVFPSLKKAAEEFSAKFVTAKEIFTPEAIDWVRKRVEPFMLERRFALSGEGRDHFVNYRLEAIDEGLILPTTQLITHTGGLENLTGYDFDAMSEYGHICVGTVVDGKIVSAACTNYPCDLDEPDELGFEIGVETAEAWRKKGFAASNCAALASMLLSHGSEVLYECESKNPASVGLIKKLGGVEFAKNFCVVAEKIG